MEAIKVGIRVQNRDFGKALARGLALESRKMFFYIEESDMDSCDLILTDKSSCSDREIYLSEKAEKELYLQEKPYSVYRYLNSCKMVDSLFYAYFRLTGRNLSAEVTKKCRLVTGLALSGGIWTSTILASAAQMLSLDFGSRCLYLSLCPFNNVSERKAAPKGCFLKMIYYLQDKKDFPLGIFISKTENVDYLAREIFNPWFMEMNKELLLKLLKQIDEEAGYDFLFIDFGSHISDEALKIAEESEEILLFKKFSDKRKISFSEKFSEISRLEILSDVPKEFSADDERTGIKRSTNLNYDEDFKIQIRKITKWIGENTDYGK